MLISCEFCHCKSGALLCQICHCGPWLQMVDKTACCVGSGFKRYREERQPWENTAGRKWNTDSTVPAEEHRCRFTPSPFFLSFSAFTKLRWTILFIYFYKNAGPSRWDWCWANSMQRSTVICFMKAYPGTLRSVMITWSTLASSLHRLFGTIKAYTWPLRFCICGTNHVVYIFPCMTIYCTKTPTHSFTRSARTLSRQFVGRKLHTIWKLPTALHLRTQQKYEVIRHQFF